MSTEFDDPRLVASYDTVNAYLPGTQPDFVAQLAAEIDANTIVDFGCGTGIITCDLARRGHTMIGVDPAPLMIERARQKDATVRWIVGGAEAIGTPAADLAIMTGHVAQFFVTDDAWDVALRALHNALRPGGRLAFETRNPAVREWEHWTSTRVTDAHAGMIEHWQEVQDVRNGVVAYTNHYRFESSGEEFVVPCRLRFRTQAELTRSLAAAGFVVEQLYGDWDRRPAGPNEREFIVVALRPHTPG